MSLPEFHRVLASDDLTQLFQAAVTDSEALSSVARRVATERIVSGMNAQALARWALFLGAEIRHLVTREESDRVWIVEAILAALDEAIANPQLRAGPPN